MCEPHKLSFLVLQVEEGCALTAADEIAAAVHHVLCIIEAEATAQQSGCSPPAWAGQQPGFR
jgi:hypothetical protein